MVARGVLMNDKNHIVYIDVARCVAILCVVACHAIELDYYFVRFGKMEVTIASWIFQNVIFTIGRLGVPLFLMITGALMLGREYNTKKFLLTFFFADISNNRNMDCYKLYFC